MLLGRPEVQKCSTKKKLFCKLQMIRNQCYYLVANGLTMQHHSGHFCKNSSYNININVLQENYTKQMIVLLLQALALHYVKAQLPCISIDLASLPTNKYIMYGSVIALQFNIPLICNTVSSDNLVWSQFLYQLSQQHTLECTNSCDLVLGHACSNRACLSNQRKLYIDWHQKTESNWWVFCFLATEAEQSATVSSHHLDENFRKLWLSASVLYMAYLYVFLDLICRSNF